MYSSVEDGATDSADAVLDRPHPADLVLAMGEPAVRERLRLVEHRTANGEFNGSAEVGGPVMYRYPAVMMPEFQRAVTDAVAPRGVDPILTLDPFVGSGTTMCEASLRGFPFVGADVNPLAILICRVKSGPFQIAAFRSAMDRVTRFARKARLQACGICFAR